MTLSLQTRLLLAATIVLAAFLGMTGLVLDNAFRDSAETALRDRLQGHIYALLAAAELDADNAMQIPEALPDPRFATSDSGLFAVIKNQDLQEIWRSRSAIGIELNFSSPSQTGKSLFREIALNSKVSLLVLSYGVEWETVTGDIKIYHFYVAENLKSLDRQLRHFRRSLWVWLGAAGILLLAVQGTILRWGLSPLRQVAADLANIKAGHSQHLHGNYPKELRGLTDNLNALISSAQTQLGRYRDALGNLAHSLKTPLAVLRGATESKNDDASLRATVKDQLDHMNQIVDFQLQRAATAGPTTLASVPVAPVIHKVIAALSKVYTEKNVACRINIGNDTMFNGDEGDLLEIVGNLADNAYKHCQRNVNINASNARTKDKLDLSVEDDGPGMDESKIEQLLQRGQRGDNDTVGHGIGLAIVKEAVHIYGGELAISRGSLGGALIQISI